MSKIKTKDELSKHKSDTIQTLDEYLSSLISDDLKKSGKADKLCYWITDWVKFLKFEESFNPASLRRYKRGEIIKAHLGFNIGSEEGGLHYCVVIDKNNAKTSPVLNVIPLTSLKPGVDVNKLRKGSIFLGNELYSSLNSKISTTSRHLKEELLFAQNLLKKAEADSTTVTQAEINNKISELTKGIISLNKMRAAVAKMKTGSIALINQITTISKIRIYDPKTDFDVLSGIKLSNEKLDLIDCEIIKLYTNS